MPVVLHREGKIGLVTMDNAPVNAIGQSLRAGLLAAVEWAHREGLERVILTGAGHAFAAGADAREFDLPPQAPHLPDVANAIEASDVPWIAAVNGVALGGGLELALACRGRVVAPRVQLGLPEVTLGVVPGAGGTQRLPRLVGLGVALDMITTGKPVSSDDARAMGLVDLIAEDPVAAAMTLPLESLGQAVSERPAPAQDSSITDSILAKLDQKARQQIAPKRAADLVMMSTTHPLADALQVERETFLDLRMGDQAKALRHIFFAERAAKMPTHLADLGAPLTSVVVVGGGTMGAGIAYALSLAGLAVTILETDPDAVARAKQNFDRIAKQSLARGLLSQSKADALGEALTVTMEDQQIAGADLAIEAAFESMSVKQEIFARLERVLRPEAVLASNTSYLDLDLIASGLKDPTRLVGLHFFAPAHVMKLLEIVRGAATSDRSLATGYDLAKRLRKIPVLAGVCDGFVGNRILARFREAADTVFMDGSTPWDVDEAMVDFGYAMGPYEAQDLSGLDIAHANRRRQDATRDPKRRYIPIADRMVELGKLGRKTGAGWYRYPGGGGKVEDPIVADLALEEAHFAGIKRTDYKPGEIQRRLVLAMINEASDILHEGIAQTAADIDLVTVFGYGFPRWRGGLMWHADTIGAASLRDQLRELAEEDPVAWKVSPLIDLCADEGLRIADWRRK